MKLRSDHAFPRAEVEAVARTLADPAAEPWRHRLRPAAEDWPDADRHDVFANIFAAKGGGALRTIVTGAMKRRTGWITSRKTGRRQPYEGKIERSFARLSEIDHRVVDYQTQRFRFEVSYAGRLHVWISDIWRLLMDGTEELVELKRDEHDLADSDYRLTLACVAEVCRRIDMRFRIVLEREIFMSKAHRRNVDLFYSRRSVRIEPVHRRRLDALLARDGHATTYGRLAAALEPRDAVVGRALAQGLACRGLVAIDLVERLVAETPVVILT